MANPTHDLNELKRRMHGAIQLLKQELGGLRTGRASAGLLEPIQVEAYGTHMPLNQVATVSVPEPRLISVQVWDRSMVHAVEKAIAASNLGLTPSTEGQVLRLRIPELNEERRKDLVKVAHKYAEAARVAVRHVRRDGLDVLKKLLKDHQMSEDDEKRSADQVQKLTDETIGEIASAHLRHHDIQEHQIRLLVPHPLQGDRPGRRGDHREPVAGEDALEQLDVHRRIVHHQDAGRVVHRALPGRSSISRTAATNWVTSMGLAW